VRDGPYSFKSRFEEGQSANPEELIGAAMLAASGWR
jgi:organic hydroperoxide reductase OsmC/OhrA